MVVEQKQPDRFSWTGALIYYILKGLSALRNRPTTSQRVDYLIFVLNTKRMNMKKGLQSNYMKNSKHYS